jgi:hypothetical protein
VLRISRISCIMIKYVFFYLRVTTDVSTVECKNYENNKLSNQLIYIYIHLVGGHELLFKFLQFFFLSIYLYTLIGIASVFLEIKFDHCSNHKYRDPLHYYYYDVQK